MHRAQSSATGSLGWRLYQDVKVAAPVRGLPAGDFLWKRQAHRKNKSSASESFALQIRPPWVHASVATRRWRSLRRRWCQNPPQQRDVIRLQGLTRAIILNLTP